jgi:hypothetical protein
MEGSPFKGPELPEDEIARMESEGGPPTPEEATASVDYMQPENPQTIPIPRPEATLQPENPTLGPIERYKR